MGNCLVMGERVIRVVKPDGKVIEYTSPVRAVDLASEFPGHYVSETGPGRARLRAEARLRAGAVYCLVPVQPKKKKKKSVRFSEPEKELGQERKGGKVVRIKLVISKQELQELLKKGGVSSLGDMVDQINGCDDLGLIRSCGGGDDRREGFWKPALESIPEVD